MGVEVEAEERKEMDDDGMIEYGGIEEYGE